MLCKRAQTADLSSESPVPATAEMAIGAAIPAGRECLDRFVCGLLVDRIELGEHDQLRAPGEVLAVGSSSARMAR
jgi:hypothetical protein